MKHSRTFALVVFGLLVAGCYSLQPVTGVRPDAGRQVALDITDAGRQALSGSMGPQIDQVTGRLISADSAEYNVAVREVRYLRGDTQVWRGESVRIPVPFVARAYTKDFSKSRTILFTTVAVAAGVLLAGKAVTGFFPERPPNDDSLPDNPTRKGTIRLPIVLPPTIFRLTPPRSF